MYAAKIDITDKYGDDALYPAQDSDGMIDDVKVTKALESATAEIDSYLGVRFTLPLPSIPDLLKEACIDMAVYKMSPTADTLTDEIKDRYKAAKVWLKDISAGRASLGLPSAPGRTSARPVVTTGTKKLFSRSEMRGL